MDLTPVQVNALYPIIGAVLRDGGLELMRLNLNPYHQRPDKQTERGRITYLTRQSRTRLAYLVGCNGWRFRSLMTMTYPANYPRDGRKVKRDLNLFLTRMRQVKGLFSYVWFLEFQRRGAPHFHVLTSLSEPTGNDREWFAGVWASCAVGKQDWLYSTLNEYRGRLFPGVTLTMGDAVRSTHRFVRAWEGLREKDGAFRYVCKYSLKPYQKRVPPEYQNVGRFWGASRDCGLPEGEVVYGGEKQIREFVELKGRDFKSVEVLPKIILY